MVIQQGTPKHQAPAAVKDRKRSGNGDKKQRSAGTALIVGIVSALVAGLLSFLVTHHHDQDVANQAQATKKAQIVRQHISQQAQAAGQLEKAAYALYKSTDNVYSYQVKCARQGNTWPVCAALAPGTSDFSATTATFDTDRFNLTDQTAAELTSQFSHMSIGTVEASSAAQGQELWTNMVTAYLKLVKRCGQLIHG